AGDRERGRILPGGNGHRGGNGRLGGVAAGQIHDHRAQVAADEPRDRSGRRAAVLGKGTRHNTQANGVDLVVRHRNRGGATGHAGSRGGGDGVLRGIADGIVHSRDGEGGAVRVGGNGARCADRRFG